MYLTYTKYAPVVQVDTPSSFNFFKFFTALSQWIPPHFVIWFNYTSHRNWYKINDIPQNCMISISPDAVLRFALTYYLNNSEFIYNFQHYNTRDFLLYSGSIIISPDNYKNQQLHQIDRFFIVSHSHDCCSNRSSD